ncbi:WD repeat-containing protein 19-like isoform X2 [Paramacrobiotus metropolitanus]|uniref:WD repeat-containing protein 19-like isoform X2 n=1 Tax=Paramacrobiotus metropolitanus TaxID=2943436 RepID=UPI002445FBC7|nr:WD repeat-containing protein 19-like isoform X2 [Paramacrobiotus metropolitanus]
MSGTKAFFTITSDFLRDKHRDELFLEWQPTQSHYLAVGSPLEKRILLYDRPAKQTRELSLPAPCSHLAWSRHGLCLSLACSQGASTALYLWTPGQPTLSMEKGAVAAGEDLGKVTWMGWSPVMDVLAVAYSSGIIVLLDKSSDKRTVVRGDHNGVISDAAWSADGILASCSSAGPASGGDAGQMSRIVFIDCHGEKVLTPRECPYGNVHRLQFASSKFVQTGLRRENTLCCVANRKTLVLFNLEDENRSLQYSFKTDYGDISEYTWFGDGYVVLCFQKGILIWVSSHPDEQGKELQHSNVFQNKIVDMAAVMDGSRFAICSHSHIKIFHSDVSKSQMSELPLPDGSHMLKLKWTSDGALLAAIGGNGQGFVFLTKVPDIGCVWRNKACYMVSLEAFNIASMPTLSEVTGTVSCKFEPAMVALGPQNFAAVMNNLVVYYIEPNASLETPAFEILGRYEYAGSVQSIQLSWNTAVLLLTDGRILTHKLHPDPTVFLSHVEETITALDIINNVSCMALADTNVYFGTSTGTLGFLSLNVQKYEAALHHTCGIIQIFLKEDDAIVAYLDVANAIYLYNIIQEISIKVEGFNGKPNGLHFDWSVQDFAINFVVYDHTHAQCFISIANTIFGHVVEEVKAPSKNADQVQRNECIIGFNSGNLVTLLNGVPHIRKLSVFPQNYPVEMTTTPTKDDVDKLRNLHRYREAAQICKKEGWKDLLPSIAGECLRNLDLPLAIALYRESGCYDKVTSIERYRDLENIQRLCGYMALVDNQPELACKWFLQAHDPLTVLDIYSDLMQWERAIALAEMHAPDKVGYACQQHAQQLEFLGDYPEALINYERALSLASDDDFELKVACKHGLAKVSFRMNDLSRGFALCQEVKNPALTEECAGIVEEGKHYKEAGRLYKECGNFFKTATMYLKAREMKLAEEVINQTDSIPLKVQLAAAKESAGDHKGAIKLYEAAGEYDAMVKILLEGLNRTDLAIEIVDRTKSQEGAKMVAAHFMKLKDFPSAIRYLLISNRGEEAFLTARQFNQMDVFAQVIGNDHPAHLYEKIARYYEDKRDIVNASHFFSQAHKSQRAVDLLLSAVKKKGQPAAEKQLLELLVAATVKANDTATTEKTSQFLLGSEDGNPRGSYTKLTALRYSLLTTI